MILVTTLLTVHSRRYHWIVTLIGLNPAKMTQVYTFMVLYASELRLFTSFPPLRSSAAHIPRHTPLLTPPTRTPRAWRLRQARNISARCPNRRDGRPMGRLRRGLRPTDTPIHIIRSVGFCLRSMGSDENCEPV